MPAKLGSVTALHDWLTLLDGMAERLSGTLAAQPDEQSPPSDQMPVPSSRAAELRSRLDETLRGLEHRLSAARALAERVEGMLDSDEQFVRAWQQTAKAARERLAAKLNSPGDCFPIPHSHSFENSSGISTSSI
jgi:hypothetical protein